MSSARGSFESSRGAAGGPPGGSLALGTSVSKRCWMPPQRFSGTAGADEELIAAISREPRTKTPLRLWSRSRARPLAGRLRDIAHSGSNRHKLLRKTTMTLPQKPTCSAFPAKVSDEEMLPRGRTQARGQAACAHAGWADVRRNRAPRLMARNFGEHSSRFFAMRTSNCKRPAASLLSKCPGGPEPKPKPVWVWVWARAWVPGGGGGAGTGSGLD